MESLFDSTFPPPDTTEVLKDLFQRALSNLDMTKHEPVLSQNKDESIVVKISTKSIYNPKGRPLSIAKFVKAKESYFIVSTFFIHENANIKFKHEPIKGKQDLAKIIVGDITNELLQPMIIEFISTLVIYQAKGNVSDYFDCCGRFQKCSTEKKCVHDDLLYAYSCVYRKNLENNRIFY